MNLSCYDVLDVDPSASPDEIRAAWRRAVADLDPTDRRFRAYNQAAEVLLDPDRRAAYDAELAADSAAEQATAPDATIHPEPTGEPVSSVGPGETTAGRSLPLVPGWVLVVVAGLVAGALVVAGVLLSRPSDAAVANDTQAAQAAA